MKKYSRLSSAAVVTGAYECCPMYVVSVLIACIGSRLHRDFYVQNTVKNLNIGTCMSEQTV